MFTYKVVLVGDFGTGKTSLIRRFVDNSFSEDYISTIGVSISKKEIISKDKKSTIMLWDIEGKTDFKPVFTHYLNGSKGFIIVADLTRKKTVDAISEHIEACEKTAPGMPICIALNKSDLSDLSDLISVEVDYEEIKALSPNIVTIVKTSAKKSSGVDEIFECLNNTIVESIS